MALSTTQYGYIIDPMVPFTDGKGKTIKDGFVRVFVAGSSTPVVTYRNFDGAANQDLIELDNSGRTKTSVIGSKGLTYKVCVYDAFHSQESPILTVDKVSVIGANITAGAGATLVTGLNGLTTKPDGFVDASVVGTDGYVALDHTLVTDDLDTDAKVTAVEEDRYIPLLNEDVNDTDSKMTLGRLWQWVLGKIKSLSTTITAFRTGDVIPVDGPDGTAKMGKDDLLRETAENALRWIHEIAEDASSNDLLKSYYIPLDSSSKSKKALASLIATFDGNLSIIKSDFSQNGTRILSSPFHVNTGDILVFDGSSNSATGRVLKYVGGTYTELNSFVSKFDYVASEDMDVCFDLTKEGGYSVSDYVEGSCVIARAMSVKAIELLRDNTSFLLGEDGTTIVVKDSFTQNGTKLLSKQLSANKGQWFIFDGTSDSSSAQLMKRVGGTYTTIAESSNHKLLYQFTEDIASLYIDLRKSGTYSLDDYNDSCRFAKYVSATTIKNIYELCSSKLNNKPTLVTKNQFIQNGAKLLSTSLSVKKGQWFIFDGTSDSSSAQLLTYEGGTYTSIAESSNHKLLYQLTEDVSNLYIDLRKSGTYSLDDYNDSCRFAEYVSSQTLDNLDKRITDLETGGTTYYYANVKNGRLCAGTTDSATNRADYLAVEMHNTISKVGCKWYWANGGHSSKGVVAMAVMPDTWTKKISGTNGITGKSLHLTITPTLLKVDFLGNDWGSYYYTNLINQAVSLSTSSSDEHEISMEISGESIAVVLDGVTYTGTNTSDKSMSDVVGKYAFIEHYWQQNTDNVDMPEFSAFRVETATMVMFDAFAREPGIPAVTPQGLPYINLSNDSKGEMTKTSYPDW